MPAEKIPSWIERLLLPKLSEITGEIKAVNTRIDALESNMNTRINGLDGKIDSLRNETKSEIGSLRNEMKSLETQIKSEFKGLDYRFESIDVKLDRIPVIEEITALKLKIADIEKRLAEA